MEVLPDEEGINTVVFRGTAEDILKLAQIFRTAAEKRSHTTVTVEEQYDEQCALKVTAEERDMSLVNTIVNMLGERK